MQNRGKGRRMDKQKLINKRTKKATETRKKNREAKLNRTYLDREWLFSRYCIDRMSLESIGRLCGVEYEVIWKALKKLKIPILIMVERDFWWDWVKKNKDKITYKEIGKIEYK